MTWFVNSASHTWGAQEYATGDQSRNNWWVRGRGRGRGRGRDRGRVSG